MDEQANPLERDHDLSVVLPGGLEKNATVHGSKPVMDLLVTLCASYHLNPSDYTVEVLSPNKNIISFKPNSPIGSLEAEKIVLKPKGMEEKIKKPYMPEATVRLLINYNKSHKAVVRVNPRVPLETLLPAVCDKCELNVETTVLLRESLSEDPLDLTMTLNEHGLREVFAKDTASKDPADQPHRPKTPDAGRAVTPTEVISPPPLQELPKKEKKQKENAGFLSLFRRRKNKPETEGASSAPTSPCLNKQASGSVNELGFSSSNTLPADMPKKRRAPQPPMCASQSVPNNLSSCHLGGAQGSAESTLRSTKRRAPPPPCVNTHQRLEANMEVKGTVDSLNTLQELPESDESDSLNLSLSSPSSPRPPKHPSSSFPSRSSLAYLHEVADPYLSDLSDARSALAKVLTSSVSKGTLVRRLKNSATFPKLHNGSCFMSVTQECQGSRDYRAELESVLKSNPPTEPKWEDPMHKTGMTTFKVVPSKKQKSYEIQVTLDVPQQCQVTVEDRRDSVASPKRYNQRESEEDPCSPDRAQTETPSFSPEPCSPCSEDILVSDRPASPSSQHDLDSQDCPGSPLSEVRDTDEKLEEGKKPEVISEETQTPALDCSDEELASDGQIKSETQSEVLQSPSTQSLSTDMDLIAPCADEKKGGEVVQSLSTDMDLIAPCADEKEEGEVVLQSPSAQSLSTDMDLIAPCVDEKEEGEVVPQSPNTQSLSTDMKLIAPCADEKEEGEVVLQSPSTQSLSTDMDLIAPCADEKESGEVVPQSPSTKSLSTDMDLIAPGADEKESGEVVPQSPSTQSLSTDMDLIAPCADEKESGEVVPQSPSAQSLSTDMDHIAPCVDEKEEGEVVPQSPSTQSLCTDMELCGLSVDEREGGEVVQEEEEEEDSFPPPPSPVFFNEELLQEPQSPTSNSQTKTLSEDHQSESTSAKPEEPSAAPTPPRDKMSTAPSRFAQAVAQAVQRARLKSRRKASGPVADTLPSPPRSAYQYGA
ncbi:cordon-bleu protein-like 1 [Scomber scombrus]|uniref:Cordon-bleu protein-like 1 n=1 Tax=Scomber scombrus TaxID=13677 RepID=A0AAV1P2R8_SCOSC